jgi:hypothetical protein
LRKEVEETFSKLLRWSGLFFLFIGSAYALKPDTSLCALRLALEKKTFARPIKKGPLLRNFFRQDQVAVAVYNEGNPKVLQEKLRQDFIGLLLDGDGQINPSALRDDFHFALMHFFERNGKFVILMDFVDFSSPDISRYGDGRNEEIIYISAKKLLLAAVNAFDVRASLLSDLIHELRHSIVDHRTYRKGKASGVDQYYFYSNLDANQGAIYSKLSEEQTVEAERKFIPQASNSNRGANYYPLFQAIQMIMNSYRKVSVENFPAAIAKNSYYLELIDSYVDSYISLLREVQNEAKLPPRLEKTLGLLQKQLSESDSDDSIEIYVDAAMDNLARNLTCIEGRLNEDKLKVLRNVVRQRFEHRQQRLKYEYDKVLVVHSEQIPKASN